MGTRTTPTKTRRRAQPALNLVEAAAAVGLSVPTLRRHIRAGRLPAHRVRGKYGEEYRIDAGALKALGLPVRLPPKTRPARTADRAGPSPDARAARALSRVAEAIAKELRALRQELARLRSLLARLGELTRSR